MDIRINSDTVFPTGCWISGHWGQYGPDCLIQHAVNNGFGRDVDDLSTYHIVSCALGRLDDMGTRRTAFEDACVTLVDWYNHSGHVDRIDVDDPVIYEWIIEVSQDAEDYMNALIPDDDNGDPIAQFGWYDGEWYLWTLTEWEETF